MEEIYLKALATRVQNEPDLMGKLPEEVRQLVTEKLNENEII